MKYVIYARVSPRGSDFEGETSIDMQIQYCREWVKFHGGEVTGVFTDEFKSGSDTNRPAFQKLWRELLSGRSTWDAIIVYKLSRFSRSQRDSVNLMADLFQYSKGFVSATENFDYSSPAGRGMLGMMQVFNQMEREQTAENTRNKMCSIAAAGGCPHGLPPFGYKRGARKDNKLYVDEVKAAIVRNIFEMYAGNTPMLEIKRKYRGQVSSSQIYMMLRNKTYLGKIVYDGKEYPGLHEPIISEELFQAAANMLPNQERGVVERRKSHKYDYLLTGLVYCSCGSPLVPASAKNGIYHYYECRNPDCHKKRVRAEKIEEAAYKKLKSIDIPDSVIARTEEKVKKAHEKYLLETEPEIQKLRRGLGKIKQEKDKLVKALVSASEKGDVSVSLQKALNEKSEQLEALEKSQVTQLSLLEQSRKGGGEFYAEAMRMARDLRRFVSTVKRENLDRISLKRAYLANIEKITFLDATATGKDRYLIETIQKSSSKVNKWLPRRDLNPN